MRRGFPIHCHFSLGTRDRLGSAPGSNERLQLVTPILTRPHPPNHNDSETYFETKLDRLECVLSGATPAHTPETILTRPHPPNLNDSETFFETELDRLECVLSGATLETTPEDIEKSHGIKKGETEDVYCGQGEGTYGLDGNQFWIYIAQKYVEVYNRDGQPRDHKQSTRMKLVHLIRCRGGRFLKYDDETEMWYEIGDKKASDKAGTALRYWKKQQAKKKSKGK